MRKIFQKWPLGGVLGLILLSVSVSTSCMQGKGQGQARCTDRDSPSRERAKKCRWTTFDVHVSPSDQRTVP